MKKNKEKHKGGVRAREHSDIAMLPRSMWHLLHWEED